MDSPARTIKHPSGSAAAKRDGVATDMPALPDSATLVNCWPGPAVVARPDGAVLAANRHAKPLVSALQSAGQTILGDHGPSAHPSVTRTELAIGQARVAHDLICLPTKGSSVVVLARDAAYETNLIQALMRSRELMRDLMRCTADFGWEADSDGTFSYVSSEGALGYAAEEMIGRAAADLLQIDPDDEQAAMAFRAPYPIRRDTIWVRGRDGAKAALWVSAIPVADEDGRWRGARGICRDVTRVREQEAASRLDQARQTLLAKIIIALRTESSPEQILGKAAQVTADALRAESFWILRDEQSAAGEIAAQTPGLDPVRVEKLTARITERPEFDEPSESVLRMGLDRDDYLVAFAGSKTGLSGALVIARDTEAAPWRAHEVELVDSVADHLGVALRQAEMFQRLERLSRIDELTGLFNRRAFFEEVDRRLGHQRRSGRPGCFLFTDLDHFKEINDSLGHVTGDAVLCAFGAQLREHCRVADVVGRLGGDEFAIWLEETGAADGMKKAEHLLGTMNQVRETVGITDKRLGMSIGVADSPAGAFERGENLAEVADKALYQAKRRGRGRAVLVERGT